VAAAEAGADADDEGDEDGVVEDELLDELHAAADSPRNAMPRTATARRPDDRKVSMITTIASATCARQEP
jgi:hypothetical protein